MFANIEPRKVSTPTTSALQGLSLKRSPASLQPSPTKVPFVKMCRFSVPRFLEGKAHAEAGCLRLRLLSREKVHDLVSVTYEGKGMFVALLAKPTESGELDVGEEVVLEGERVEGSLTRPTEEDKVKI